MPPMELDMQQAASAAPADAESRTARAPVVVVVPPAAPAPEPQTSLMVRGSAISRTNKKARSSADGVYSVSVNTVPGGKTAGTELQNELPPGWRIWGDTYNSRYQLSCGSDRKLSRSWPLHGKALAAQLCLEFAWKEYIQLGNPPPSWWTG